MLDVVVVFLFLLLTRKIKTETNEEKKQLKMFSFVRLIYCSPAASSSPPSSRSSASSSTKENEMKNKTNFELMDLPFCKALVVISALSFV